jgi:hypothetical protein
MIVMTTAMISLRHGETVNYNGDREHFRDEGDPADPDRERDTSICATILVKDWRFCTRTPIGDYSDPDRERDTSICATIRVKDRRFCTRTPSGDYGDQDNHNKDARKSQDDC